MNPVKYSRRVQDRDVSGEADSTAIIDMDTVPGFPVLSPNSPGGGQDSLWHIRLDNSLKIYQ